MAFPTLPSNGQQATINGITYTYNSANTAWKVTPTTIGTRITYTASNTAPSSPTSGDQWYKINQNILFEYISDGTTSTWVDIVTPTLTSSPTVSGVAVTTVSPPNSATAADIAGGETITVTGSGFSTGIIAYINTTNCNTTFVSSSSLTFTTPSTSAGTYNLTLYNTDGTSGTKPGGIVFSSPPVWVTSSGGLVGASSNTYYSQSVTATGTGITYSVTSGALPTGLSLNSNTGEITGTPTVVNSYSFNIKATNIYNQSVSRSFSILVSSIVNISYLAVAGGGSGGTGYYGGGGGAGGLIESTTDINPGTTYTIIIGSGGVGTTSPTTRGGNGANTTISGSGFTTILAYGGGGGGSRNGDASGVGTPASGANGGSGGGASMPSTAIGGKGVYPGSSYISATRQGYDGGDAPAGEYGVGGGGAGEKGHIGTIEGNRNGGNGLQSSITGSSTYYAGGGGGSYPYGYQWAGGSGGGGYGSGGTGAVANSGGGGGGGTGSSHQGGSGASGVVIIKYPDTQGAATTTGSPTVTSITGYRIYKFTGSGTFSI